MDAVIAARNRTVAHNTEIACSGVVNIAGYPFVLKSLLFHPQSEGMLNGCFLGSYKTKEIP